MMKTISIIGRHSDFRAAASRVTANAAGAWYLIDPGSCATVHVRESIAATATIHNACTRLTAACFLSLVQAEVNDLWTDIVFAWRLLTEDWEPQLAFANLWTSDRSVLSTEGLHVTFEDHLNEECERNNMLLTLHDRLRRSMLRIAISKGWMRLHVRRAGQIRLRRVFGRESIVGTVRALKVTTRQGLPPQRRPAGPDIGSDDPMRVPEHLLERAQRVKDEDANRKRERAEELLGELGTPDVLSETASKK